LLDVGLDKRRLRKCLEGRGKNLAETISCLAGMSGLSIGLVIKAALARPTAS